MLRSLETLNTLLESILHSLSLESLLTTMSATVSPLVSPSDKDDTAVTVDVVAPSLQPGLEASIDHDNLIVTIEDSSLGDDQSASSASRVLRSPVRAKKAMFEKIISNNLKKQEPLKSPRDTVNANMINKKTSKSTSPSSPTRRACGELVKSRHAWIKSSVDAMSPTNSSLPKKQMPGMVAIAAFSAKSNTTTTTRSIKKEETTQDDEVRDVTESTVPEDDASVSEREETAMDKVGNKDNDDSKPVDMTAKEEQMTKVKNAVESGSPAPVVSTSKEDEEEDITSTIEVTAQDTDGGEGVELSAVEAVEDEEELGEEPQPSEGEGEEIELIDDEKDDAEEPVVDEEEAAAETSSKSSRLSPSQTGAGFALMQSPGTTQAAAVVATSPSASTLSKKESQGEGPEPSPSTNKSSKNVAKKMQNIEVVNIPIPEVIDTVEDQNPNDVSALICDEQGEDVTMLFLYKRQQRINMQKREAKTKVPVVESPNKKAEEEAAKEGPTEEGAAEKDDANLGIAPSSSDEWKMVRVDSHMPCPPPDAAKCLDAMCTIL